jgi:hypothetical protein
MKKLETGSMLRWAKMRGDHGTLNPTIFMVVEIYDCVDTHCLQENCLRRLGRAYDLKGGAVTGHMCFGWATAFEPYLEDDDEV